MSQVRDLIKSILANGVRIVRPASKLEVVSQPLSRRFGMDRGRPIDRYYIEQFLRDRSALLTGEGAEVGEVKYLSLFGEGITKRTIIAPVEAAVSSQQSADEILVLDLTAVGDGDGERFDVFLCTQTLNFIEDVSTAIAGARRLLKPEGVFIGTVAGISQVSRYDAERWGDFWRFTPQGLSALLRAQFGDRVEVVNFGNVIAACALLQGYSVEDLESQDLLNFTDQDYPVILGFVAYR